MRDLKEILAELNAAEKEYEEKCRQYGIEDSSKDKKSPQKADESKKKA